MIRFLFSRTSLHKQNSLFFFHDARLPFFFFARAALPIIQQGLCCYHCLGVFVVSHEECVALLLLQDVLPRVIPLPNKKAAAELFTGGCHRLIFVLSPNKDIHRRLVFSPMLQHDPLPVFNIYVFMVTRIPAVGFYRVPEQLKKFILAHVFLLRRFKRR